MKVNVQSVNFNVDKELIDFIEKKVNSLEKYYDRIVDSDVYLKVQKTSEKENKLVEIKMNVPGNDFVVKKQCRTFEEGTMQVVDSMKRQLRKKKEKRSRSYWRTNLNLRMKRVRLNILLCHMISLRFLC